MELRKHSRRPRPSSPTGDGSSRPAPPRGLTAEASPGTRERELKPLFISGHPKSGTTLAVALLDSHPELLVFPEEVKMREVMKRGTMEERIAYLLTRTGAYLPALDGVEADWGNNRRDYSGIDGERYMADLKENLSRARDGRDILTAVFANWRRYSSVRDSEDLKYFVEKTPRNEFSRDMYLRWFPSARFLHIVRDPRDNFVSYRKLHSNLLLGRFVMDWKESTEIALADDDGEKTLLVRYEDLALRPREVMEEVSGWLGIAFSPSLLEPTKNGIPWGGNSMFSDDTGAIHARGIGRFEKGLEESRIRQIESYLFEEMKALAYEPRLAGGARRIPRHVRSAVSVIEGGRALATRSKRALGIPTAAEKKRARERKGGSGK